MRLLRKILAFLIILTFIPLTFMGTLALAVTGTYLNPDFYQSAKFQELFYEIIVEEISSQLISSQPELSQFIDPANIKEEVKIVIPPEIVSDIISDALAQLKQIPLPEEIIISTEEIKNNLPLVVDRIFTNITPESPIDTNILKQKLQQDLADYIPPRLSLPLSDLPTEAKRTLILIMLGVNHFTTSFLTSLTILITIIGLLIWKPLKSSLRWMGSPLVYAGIILFGFLYIMTVSAPQIHALAATIIGPIFSFMLPWTIAYFVIGLGAIIASFLLPKPDEQPNQNNGTL